MVQLDINCQQGVTHDRDCESTHWLIFLRQELVHQAKAKWQGRKYRLVVGGRHAHEGVGLGKVEWWCRIRRMEGEERTCPASPGLPREPPSKLTTWSE